MSEPRFLIVRPDRIGDVVLSTPIPRALKKKYPKSFVAMLIRSYTQDLFLNNPYVDETILIDDTKGNRKSFFESLKEIRKHKFTHSFTLLPEEKNNYLLFLAGIKYRVGVGHKFYQFITNTKSVYRRKYKPLRHEADYCLDSIRKIGVEDDGLGTEIFLSENEKKIVEQKRSELLGSKKYLIGIHSTSGNSAPNWKPNTYADLINELTQNQNISVVCTDNKVPSEIKSIPNIISPNVDRSLRDSILNFASLDFLISASTGPMHIAAALKVKTISLFCPLTATSPKLWAPQGNEKEILLPSENYCGNQCSGDPKNCSFEGRGGIELERVINLLEEKYF
ncbi:MAG: glycosyltransferase family 9 protein [Ignavibacteriae bacterium]|nr:lipopolysaccharide heptosyltransferase family protein [Ignavibacteriota bacterium]NOG97406.1 glycosyltransferase family 9 protein [Ignavibacteriota bacterium]